VKSLTLITFNIILYGLEAVFAPRVAKYAAKSPAVFTSFATLTTQVAVLLPSSVLTVMVALPTDTPVTAPFDIVATALLLLFHVTFLLVALEGATVAIKVSEAPSIMVVDVLFKDTPVTATGAALTVTAQVAVLFPSSVVTVIVALPADTPETMPLNDTEATVLLLLLHITFLLVALEGSIVATKVSDPPTVRLVMVLLSVTPVTATGAALTVTAQVAVLLPSSVITVIVALPTDTPVTKPFEDTVATAGALLLHVRF
jgi:hypothetical protein